MSTVYVNGLPVGSTDNMFSRYSFEVRDQLQTGENEIRLEFASPVEYAAERFAAQLTDYIVPPECVDPQFQGECHANHIRKMQASFRQVDLDLELRLVSFEFLDLDFVAGIGVPRFPTWASGRTSPWRATTRGS